MSAGCAICGRPMAPEYRPFCSKCCANVDLQRWLGGVYAIPAVEDDETDSAPVTENDEP